MEKLILALAHSHHRRYGGEWDDILAVANLAAVQARETWDAARAALTTHTWHTVRWALAKHQRRQHKHTHAGKCRHGLSQVPDRSHFDLGAFCSELSSDACQAIQLALASPKNRNNSKRADVLDQLLSNGWTKAHVSKVFTEIGDALCT